MSGEKITDASSLLNRAATRKVIFNRIAKLRPALVGKMTRISEGSFEHLEARLQNFIDDAIRQHPTVGKTINFTF